MAGVSPSLINADPNERYSSVEYIGAGGMAEVYLGMDNALGRRVVLKQVLPRHRSDPDFLQMFLNEARTVARLDHPNIVKIYDIGLRHEGPFMALEWLEGWDLHEILTAVRDASAAIPIPIILHLVREACAGLHAAHTATADDGQPLRLVHRDLSPHNLFVTSDGVLKILDFGIAKTAMREMQTAPFRIKGKFRYMSPEQITGGSLDQRSDLFSLGTVMHELLSGEPLFRASTPKETFVEVTSAPLLPPVHKHGPVPERVVQILSRMLERSLLLRYASAEELRRDLDTAIRDLRCALSSRRVAGWMRRVFAVATPAVEIDVSDGDPEQDTAVIRTAIPLGNLDLSGEEEASERPSVIAVNEAVRRFTLRVNQDGAPVPTGWRRLVRRRDRPRRGAAVLLGLAVLAAGVFTAVLWTRGGREAALEPVPATPSPAVAQPPGIRLRPLLHPVVTPKPEVANPPAPEPGLTEEQDDQRPGRVRRVEAGSRRPRSPPNQATAWGTLTINTVPWTKVEIGGKEIGVTPLAKVPVPPGRIVVRLVNREYQIDLKRTVEVPAGADVRRSYDFLHADGR